MDLSYIRTHILVIHKIVTKLKMNRFQKYRLKRKTQFEKRFEKFAKEHFPQIWELFELMEENETTSPNYDPPGDSPITEQERSVTTFVKFRPSVDLPITEEDRQINPRGSSK